MIHWTQNPDRALTTSSTVATRLMAYLVESKSARGVIITKLGTSFSVSSENGFVEAPEFSGEPISIRIPAKGQRAARALVILFSDRPHPSPTPHPILN